MKPTLIPAWTPSQHFKDNANISHYMAWLKNNYDLSFEDYESLWQWSVDDIDLFWESLWNYFEILSDKPYTEVKSDHSMPYTRWFSGSEINYAEHIFRNATEHHPAIIYKSEDRQTRELSWQDLKTNVAAFKRFLIDHGVEQGDRVVAYLPNIPEATIAFLATNAMGAIWSSTSPDFGTSSVVDRFQQIQPKILIAVDGYNYGGKTFNRIKEVDEIAEVIDSIELVVLLPQLHSDSRLEKSPFVHWQKAIQRPWEELTFARVPFNHPIWVLYSSGTTGIPKAITHSQGGVLLEHLKYLTFHNDVHPGERCFWYTTTGWMMWNYIQASLLCGGIMVLYDGSPAYPNLNILWHYAEEIGISHFGTSASFIVTNIKASIHPGHDFNLDKLVSIGSTGSPLPPEGFDWIFKEVKQDLWLTSISGGTDVCSAFVGGTPLLPVYIGEIQCRALGCRLEAYDDQGVPVYETMGEMVITAPMPSMPVYFWNDENYQRYVESYFEMYPGVWRHGDWTEITARKGVIIYGRSDATLNRGGIRIGTSEIYSAVDGIAQIADSMVVYLDKKGIDYMPLFIKLAPDHQMTESLKQEIKSTIRKSYTPRHVPDEIIEVAEIPYTISGKKMETPVKKLLMGMDPKKVVNRDAMRNPEAIDIYIAMASSLA